MTAVEPRRAIFAGHLYKGLALRYLSLIGSLSEAAERHGVTVGIPHPPLSAITDDYMAAVDRMVHEPPSTLRDALALVEFAAAVTADNAVFEALNDSTPVGDVQDRVHVMAALHGVCAWLNQSEIAEYKAARGAA